ncbi:MAG: zinc-dependent alcohol dehydrogenase family protein [Aquisalinus sp.]|nr:zinc-dependent alcohol dehydrogenase family protein [Aquisalinus sp.]
MKAMVLNQYGEEAKFDAAEMEKPDAAPGHVVIKVAATSVNTVDTMIRSLGQAQLPFAPDLPAVLGMDFSGTIEAVGDGVTGYSKDDQVYGCTGGLADLQGALAEYMPADARLISHKPKSLSMRQAAALPLAAITAYEGLHRAGIGKDQKVLVHGGTGGVGHIAVQLAKHYGADVYATVSSDEQGAIVENYGATAINYKTQRVEEYVAAYTSGVGFDVIFDSVGGANLSNSFAAAALNAHVATTVSLLEIDLSPAHFKGLSLHVVFMLIQMLHDYKREDHAAMLADMASIADAGALTPLLDSSMFSMTEVGQAYDRLASGKATGKIVIDL